MSANISIDAVESAPIRRIAEIAIAEGYAVENAAWWSKAFVVWMSKPLTLELKERLLEQFNHVKFEEWPGGPHDHGSRSFVDGDFAVAFPWTKPPVR